MLCVVLLAVFGLVTLLLSGLVALAWRVGLARMRMTAGDFLTLRLFPVIGAGLLVLGVILPAFLRYEPLQEQETVGPLLVILAAFSLVAMGHGVWRGWRACAAVRALRIRCGPVMGRMVADGQEVQVVDIFEPIVAVVGAWRPQVIAARPVLSVCTPEELEQVLAHEVAHVAARDNLKKLLLVVSPDVLAWTPLGATLIERWRSAAEREADLSAAGDDPRRRVALAAALIKVARLAGAEKQALPFLSMSVAADEVEGRVRQLLASPVAAPAGLLRPIGLCALLTPLAAWPLHGLVHELIEVLVRLGS
jgi:Zn-dependent protease with chaperone function